MSWGHLVVVSEAEGKRVLQLLHDIHQGISAMKRLAWSLLWYPRIDKDIEHLGKTCYVCVQAAPMPPCQTPVSRPKTGQPWSRAHIDFAGLVEGYMLLIVVVDSHSKWIEAVPLKTATAGITTDTLRTLFSTFVLPQTIITDNGLQFASQEFSTFIRRNGIDYVRTAPYHPQSSRLAEQVVCTIKQGLKKNRQGSVQTQLVRLLHIY